jgi:hypothetical protein
MLGINSDLKFTSLNMLFQISAKYYLYTKILKICYIIFGNRKYYWFTILLI